MKSSPCKGNFNNSPKQGLIFYFCTAYFLLYVVIERLYFYDQIWSHGVEKEGVVVEYSPLKVKTVMTSSIENYHYLSIDGETHKVLLAKPNGIGNTIPLVVVENVDELIIPGNKDGTFLSFMINACGWLAGSATIFSFLAFGRSFHYFRILRSERNLG